MTMIRETTYDDITRNLRAILCGLQFGILNNRVEEILPENPDYDFDSPGFENLDMGPRPVITEAYLDRISLTSNPSIRQISEKNNSYIWVDSEPVGFVAGSSNAGLIIPRYNDMVHEIEGSSGRQCITWEIDLDMLVNGDTDSNIAWQEIVGNDYHTHPGDYLHGPNSGDGMYGMNDVVMDHAGIPSHYHRGARMYSTKANQYRPTGIYSPDRGRIVEFVVRRLGSFPALRHPDLQSEYIEDMSNPFFAPTYDISISAKHDSTDLNYWTLLWSYGIPSSYGKWWPTTIAIQVKHKFQPEFIYP